MKIVFLPETLVYFNRLSDILYEQGYFSFKDNSLKYVDDLLEDIKLHLHSKVKKPAPGHFEKYGHNLLYAVFPKNNTTFWYIFFNIYRQNGELVYLIRYVSNNHVIAQYL